MRASPRLIAPTQLDQSNRYKVLWSPQTHNSGYLSFALGYPLGFPLADHILARADAVLGFDWPQWGVFAQAHWLFERAQDFGYVSYIWQPVAAVAVAAIWAPRA